jgi:protein-disulfide isomerase
MEEIRSASKGSLLWRRLRSCMFVGLIAALLVFRGSAQTPPPESAVDLTISVEGAPVLGDPHARVAVVEFADYQCPYCKAHAQRSLQDILAHYVWTGKIRYYHKDLPVESSHPQAFKAAEAARCAGEQDKYWEMHDRLMRSPKLDIVSELSGFALDLKLHVPKFQECLDSGIFAPKIRADIQDSNESGVKATPTFFVGAMNSQSTTMHAVTMIYGAQPYAIFREVLDRTMAAGDEKAGRNDANARP